VRATIRNRGERTELTLRIAHDGVPVTTETVTVGTRETVDVEFEVTFEEPRTGVVEVNGVSAGELTVGEENEESPDESAETDEQSGFGAVVTLLAVLVATLWARSSTRDDE